MSTALVLVDLQNAFCRADGSFARRGFRIEGLDAVLAGCVRLRDAAAARGWAVVLTRLVYAQDYSDAGLLVIDRPQIPRLGAYAAGSADSDFVDALAPRPGDVVVDKTRYDPFVGTELERTLREREVGSLVVAGLLTNVCVESTVRSAHDRDFRVTVAEDATASYDSALHRAALSTMGRHFARVVALAELLGS